MKKTAALLLVVGLVAPVALGRQRVLRRGEAQWRAPQCTQITGLPWLRFVDSADQLVESIDPEVKWREPVLTTEALAIGTAPNVLWAFTSDGGIHRSANGGCTWSEQARVAEAEWYPGNFNFEPGMLAAGTRVYVYKHDRLVRLTHRTVETFTLPDLFIELAASPADPSYLRAVGQFGAVYDSNDAGTTWHRRSNAFAQLETAKINPADLDQIVFGRTRGMYMSTDGGPTVTALIPKYGQLLPWSIEFSPVDPKILWVDGYDFTGRTPRLLRSEDGGATFQAEKRYARVGWVAPSGLAAHPLEPRTFAAQNNPGVRVIGDEGKRGEWIHGNFKKAVWSPAGTLYVLHQVAELR